MQTVTEHITIEELKKMSEKMFGGMVKAVVDIERGIMVVDASLHADEESFLLEDGSKQEHLWGINLFPEQAGKDGFLVFDSMINLRPSWGNRTRGVDDPAIQKQIRQIVMKLVIP
jgi:hypothetical protein